MSGSKNIIAFTENAQLPAHLAGLFGDMPNENSALSEGVGPGFGVISYKGKDWAVVIGGERTPLSNADGEPLTSIDVIIVKANTALSKIYYANGYVEGSQDKPDCYSNDGVAPALDAQDPQSPKCATCPMNAWGSKIADNGNKVKACSDSRRMAVVFTDDLESPLLLRVPAASLKPVAKYGQELTAKQVPFQAVVTKIGFDREVAHPQFVLRPTRFLTPDEALAVKDLMQSDIVEQMVGINANPVHEGEDVSEPAGRAQVQRSTATVTPLRRAPQPQTVTRKPAAQPAPEEDPEGDETQAQENAREEPPPAPPKAPARARRTAAAAAAQPAAQPAKAAAQQVQAQPAEDALDAAAAQADKALEDILAGLDDD